MKKINGKKILTGACIVLLPPLLAAGAGYLYRMPENEQIRNAVMLGIGTLSLLYAWSVCGLDGSLDYDNASHMARFAAFFTGGILFACLLPLFPFQIWPVLALSVALSFFSNTFVGLFAYGLVIMAAVFLSEASANVFFLYFLSGAAAILLFRDLDEAYHVGKRVVITLLFFFVVQTASIVIFINERLSWEMFVEPVMNLCLTGLLLLCVLKYFSYAVIHRYRNRYQEINDPEFTVMAEMKREAREDYFLALHTAYFSERIADRIHADVALAKAGAYYHRLGRIYREKYPDMASEKDIIQKVCEENEFPPTIVEILLECADHKYRSRESSIVLFSDAVVSSILFLLSKDPVSPIDYDQVIDVIFRKKQSSGVLSECRLTISDFLAMREIFRKEKLYYDFLR